MLAVTAAIFLLTVAVLVVRYGHVRFPYREDAEKDPSKAFVRE
jgi:protein PsiE